jgi:hypothetical protein
MAAADKTTLVLPGKKMVVPRVLKRTLQIALAFALTAAVALAVVVVNVLLTGKGGTVMSGYGVWLAFMKRPDIQATMLLTAAVSVLLVYWQRDHE